MKPLSWLSTLFLLALIFMVLLSQFFFSVLSLKSFFSLDAHNTISWKW